MYEVTGAHLESRARKHCMLYVKSTGEEELRTKRQMYLHFLEDEYQPAYDAIQNAIKTKIPIPKV